MCGRKGREGVRQNMIQFTKEYSGIVFDVDIQDRISLFTGYSGTGKTFAFGAIQEYFVSNNIRTIYFDDRQMDYTADQLISLCDNKEVILLDNADLYLTQNLLDYLIDSNKILLCSTKKPYQYRFGVFGKYEVKYENNKNVGTAKLTITSNNFDGTINKEFRIAEKSIDDCEFFEIEKQAYTGLEIKPEVVVKDKEKFLEKDKDYEISYKNNKDMGTATVIVKGIGEYAGEKEPASRRAGKEGLLLGLIADIEKSWGTLPFALSLRPRPAPWRCWGLPAAARA